MRGIGDEAPLALQQLFDLPQQAVQRRLHGRQLAGQRFQLQRLQRVGMPGANHRGHVTQRRQAPANRPPQQRGEQQAAEQGREQGVAHDAGHQLAAHIVTLAGPDQQSSGGIAQQEAAPLVRTQLERGESLLLRWAFQ